MRNRSRQLGLQLTAALTWGMSLLAGTAAWAQPQPGTLDLHTGGTTPAPPSPTPTPTPAASEPEVLVAEVVVEGTDDPELIEQVYKVIRTRAGEVSTRSQLREDINAVFATGFFADVRAVPSDTPLGVRVTFEVKPNPVLIAKVIDVRTSEEGTLTLEIAEGEIEDIRVQGNTKTRDFIITRELKTKPGDVFNRNQIQEDLQAVFNLNLFQDVNVGLNPGRDPNKVVVVVNVEERRTGTLSGTLGVSSATGVFAGLSVSEENLGGNNQKASFNVQVGANETLFDLNFTDPRIATLEIPTSYSVNISNQQSSSFVFNEGLTLPNGDPVRINRLGGSITFSRPLGGNWRASLGARVQFVEARNSKGEQERFDVLGNPITFSASGQDSYTSLRLGLIHDTRDNLNTPSQGSVFRLFTEQSVRLFQNGLNANRLEASYSQFIPVKLFETRSERPQVLAFDVRAGTTLGDLAPYDAFPIGGGNSVRGFFEGGIGSGRSFATATAELRFPLFDPVGVVVFADYGTDLGSGAAVIGNPAAVRNKPGSGLGLGAGIRIQSPLGPLRIDYAVGQGEAGRAQLHFGIGEKF
jgi:outer membrane protein insertion porin family